jgi:DNA-binding transcriptional MerR regulator
MPPKLFKATDVCDLAQVQPYVLRSWEKEFPGIGVQKADGQRLYRQSDVDQVLRIKQLVFTEGLTLSGARRRLDEQQPAPPSGVTEDEVNEVLDALASDARTRIARVRNGLHSILTMLSGAPGTRVVVVDDYELKAPPAATAPARAVPTRAASARRAEARKPAIKAESARGKSAPAKRKRANA